ASFRAVVWSLWPSATPFPGFRDAADHDRFVADLVAIGAIHDAGQVYWDVRLSTQHPTLEFRTADACLTVDDVVLHAALCRALANRTGAIVVSADYRLAPEHRFPAALDDAWTVLTWLHDHAGELGADPGRLAVAGESAGANLAAVAARRAHADPAGAHPRLRAQLLAYPALDAALATASYDELGTGFGLTREQMRWYWDAYAPDGAARSPEASPLRASDLAGLPPAVIVQAELDPLLDDGLDYAQRLRAAGVEADVRVWPGMVHGFLRYRGLLDDAHAALDEAAARVAAYRADALPSQPGLVLTVLIDGRTAEVRASRTLSLPLQILSTGPVTVEAVVRARAPLTP
ncbi:MAG: alpha/beta hydrolase fold domain-containing protein, partial [Gemmatimonadetes bacterium]|nr:alpha/beta hydrolase fold domain-containing protein [Gemmatimonadota bacterium]